MAKKKKIELRSTIKASHLAVFDSQSKLSDLRDFLNTLSDVQADTLIGEIAPFAAECGPTLCSVQLNPLDRDLIAEVGQQDEYEELIYNIVKEHLAQSVGYRNDLMCALINTAHSVDHSGIQKWLMDLKLCISLVSELAESTEFDNVKEMLDQALKLLETAERDLVVTRGVRI